MSQNAHDAGHESPIKTPKQLITVVALAFLVPVLIIVLLSQFFANIRSVDKNSPAMAYDAVAKRLKPVGELAFADAGGAAKGPRSGEDVYKTVCSACHTSGAAGAPKFGDKAEWAARLKKGQKALLASAVSGLKAMPPRGGGADLSDLELERALVYLANQAGAGFKEPAAPAAAKAAPTAAAKPDGKAIYDSTCVACHGSGVAGAPKAGDKAAWAPRLKAGMDALYASALKGKGAMPIKGGNMALGDPEVKAAVDYLTGLAK
jgi:cytochrome c5